MPDSTPAPIRLPFSEKYDRSHAAAYYRKHRDGLARRLSTWRDMQLARKALHLAGDPTLVLDLPCGAGRFWPVLAEHPNRVILAADNSADMLEVAKATQLPHVVARVRTLQTSAFDIALPDRAVDSIFCMRLMHHVGDPTHRLAMLREFHRVSRDSVIVSLWVDGNYKAWRRKRLENGRERHDRRAYQNRYVLPAGQVEKEFAEAGFAIMGHLDFVPLYAMWRVYVLAKNES
ncbi:MAG TPA: methyltransferase domain-containing protein [Rhodocyclaceae bacterium]|nr:methyltransferase domain-containing protein [Rhodocyclaceae bacterium]HRQ45675.1 methyltransferase domain-containing protein [Rhodocyclaceae bacterium]